MRKIIYRKSDLVCVGTGQDFEQEVALNVIPNFSGEIGDYDFIETDLICCHLELVDGVVTVAEDAQEEVVDQPTMEERLAATEAAIIALMGV